MANKSSDRYFVTKDNPDGGFIDITELFDGVAILKLEGLLARGEATNVYTAQWVNEQEEDIGFTKWDDGTHSPIIVRKNVDIDLTFIIRQKYATKEIDVSEVHDEFIEYMTSSDLWLASAYAMKCVHCICLNAYKPTTVKLGRGDNSYIMGTLTFHCLDVPQNI